MTLSDLPHILDQNTENTQIVSTDGNNMGCDGLGELRSSNSMNDFTAILEEGNTPTKNVDNMLLSKDSIITPNKIASTTATVVTATSSVNLNVNNTNISNTAAINSSGKKRPAVTQQINPTVKKKAVAKACTKVKGNNTTVIRRAGTAKVDVVPKAKPTIVAAAPKVIDNKATNGTADPLTIQQQAQKAAAAAAAAAQKATTIVAPKAQPQSLSVAVNQRPVQVPSSYQTVKTPQLVTTTTTAATQPKITKPINAPSSAASVSSVKTEESFKGVAQAAVNNLILSAGQNAARYEAGKNDSNFVKAVDTSTAHVAALTSNNWVAACAASISDAPPGTAEAAQAAALAAASDPAAAKAARARRASLTADERARQNRDRNREHARNTRLRKKAYVEELKRTLTELVTARDAAEIEKRHEKQRELEVREVRYRVMEEFLKLRARGSEPNLLARWVAILEEGFTFTLPKTGYRDMVQSQLSRQVSRSSVAGGVATPEPIVDPTVQVLHGATECFDDASKLAAFLQTLTTGNIMQSYNCDRKKFMMDGINAMLEWSWTSAGQVSFDPTE